MHEMTENATRMYSFGCNMLNTKLKKNDELPAYFLSCPCIMDGKV